MSIRLTSNKSESLRPIFPGLFILHDILKTFDKMNRITWDGASVCFNT